MIITPTRELARQVYQVAVPFCKTVPWIQPLLLTGGSYVFALSFVCPIEAKAKGCLHPNPPERHSTKIFLWQSLTSKLHYFRLDGNERMVSQSCRDAALDVTAFQEKGGNVIIGTPGRVADVMKRSTELDTKQLEVLVLDEADRLLDMGFRTQLDFIMSRLPKQRRTGALLASSFACMNSTRLPAQAIVKKVCILE